MKKNFTRFLNILKNSRGQVALFIALVFQILFIFFAMVINVGLLVHHKINLQNSVDLAAYYGAMKQAESMGAIGHINYQIRQSWKLLTFRYRMIGSAGDFSIHPYDKANINTPKGSIEDEVPSQGVAFYEAPAFCATYVPFKPMPKDENTCKDLTAMSGITLFKSPPVIAGFLGFTTTVRAATDAMRELAIKQCRVFGTYNYLLLGSFVVAFKKDQRDRSAAITTLANGLSYAENDFYDLDGELASTGIKTTLKNNLTSANADAISDDNIKIYNSLGSEACNGSGVAPDNPPKWLTPVKTYPAFLYVDTTCKQDKISTEGKQLPITSTDTDGFPVEMPNQPPSVQQQIRDLAQFVGLVQPLSDLYNFSMGVEKNPWCMAYVGVSATASPKIPFSPFGAVKLVARSFAKPFGGRIGPWYKSGWSPGSTQSNTGTQIDPNLPPRILDMSSLGQPKDPTRAANYSRFVGDKFGMKTRNVLYQYGRAIYELDSRWATTSITDLENQQTINYADGAPNFKHWDHLPFDYGKKGGDLLAWDWDKQQPSRMRYLELAAIQPDLFDATYYSIEPDYYHNYYLRIRDKYMKGPGAGFNSNGKSFLPDYGYHQGYKAGSENLDEFSVKDQFIEAKKAFAHNEVIPQRLTWMLSQWDHTLTGWADVSLEDYSLNANTLGKCQYPKVGEADLEVPTAGNCAVGGSTGYSVKTIAHDYLMKQDLNLGGDSAGSGPLLNPPPDDF